MFAFQPPPPFAEMEQIESADAKVSDFKPIYFTKKYANLYQSKTQPLHYADRILLRANDLVLYLIEDEGRVNRVSAARVWQNLYYPNGEPIGTALVSAKSNETLFNDFYHFSQLDSQGKEHLYYRNQHTLNQTQIRQQLELLSRAEQKGEMWLPERKMIVDFPPHKQFAEHPANGVVSDEFLKSVVSRYARENNAACLFAVAFWMRERRKLPQALLGFQKSAEKNFPHAWLELGLEYLGGEMLDKNLEKATACFRQAAYGGLPLGSYYLALSYIDGIGIEQSDTLALRHMQKAAEGNIHAAYLALALYYRNGSFHHLRPPSSIYHTLTHNETNARKAAELFFQAADKPWVGAPIAMFYLAECYRTGEGLLSDKLYARELYRQASALGDIKYDEIQHAAYYNGEVERLIKVVEDNEKPFAAYLLGRMYWFGEFVEKNKRLAEYYLQIAAKSAHLCAEDASQLLQSAREYWNRTENQIKEEF